MKWAVVGSRDWPDVDFVWHVLSTLDDVDTVVSGGARGVDSMAAQWAEEHGIRVIEFLPDWNRYGKSAGFKRNVDIVNAADIVLAFQYRGSKGTQHSINLARQEGKEVIVYTERDIR